MNYRKRLILEKSKKPKKGFLNGLWKFVNSNFGIFIMTTIFVTGITNCVSNNIQERQAKIERRKEANKYYVELEFRVFSLKRIADTLVGINRINHAVNRLLKAKNVPDTGVWKIFHKGGNAYMVLLNRQINDVINGTGSYKPSDKIFQDQNLIAVLSWFSFNMDEPRPMYKEIEAVYSLQRIPPFAPKITNDSTVIANINTLFEFRTIAQAYVDGRDYSEYQ